VYWSGTEGTYNIMVMELLGCDLGEFLKHFGNKLSLKTAFFLIDQMVAYDFIIRLLYCSMFTLKDTYIEILNLRTL
jgi:hypothetical protein